MPGVVAAHPKRSVGSPYRAFSTADALNAVPSDHIQKSMPTDGHTHPGMHLTRPDPTPTRPIHPILASSFSQLTTRSHLQDSIPTSSPRCNSPVILLGRRGTAPPGPVRSWRGR